jgi:hypothetical protein
VRLVWTLDVPSRNPSDWGSFVRRSVTTSPTKLLEAMRALAAGNWSQSTSILVRIGIAVDNSFTGNVFAGFPCTSETYGDLADQGRRRAITSSPRPLFGPCCSRFMVSSYKRMKRRTSGGVSNRQGYRWRRDSWFGLPVRSRSFRPRRAPPDCRELPSIAVDCATFRTLRATTERTCARDS